jgi:hypothetical protein
MSNQPRQRPRLAADRQQIADAVHEGVLLVTGSAAASRNCPLYASAGAIVLSQLTPHRWVPQAGAAQWGTGADLDHPDGEMCFAFDPNATGPAQRMTDGVTAGRGGLAEGEFHCWAVAGDHMGRVIEIADFWARHVPAQSAIAGYPWLRGPMPLVWGPAELIEAQRFRYRTDVAATARLRDYFTFNGGLIAAAARAALHALAAARSSAPPGELVAAATRDVPPRSAIPPPRPAREHELAGPEL